MDPFWVVWNPEHGVPTVRHSALNDAKRESERLAIANEGQDFFVLRAVGLSRVKRVDWTVIGSDDDDMPF